MAWLDGTTTPRTAQALEAALRAIVNAGTAAALSIVQQGNTSASTSVGGAFNLDNTLNTGAGMVLYSNQAAPGGRLFVVRADSATFNQAAARIQSAGSAAALDVSASGTGAAITARQTNTTPGNVANHALSAIQDATSGTLSSAGNFVSSNPAASAVQITGAETGRGSLKISHLGDTAIADDQNAAALSLDLKATGVAGATNAQGIFVDATLGGTNGALMDLRNFSNLIFKVRHATTSDRTGATPLAIPILQMGATAIQITQGTGSPEGVVTAPTGSLYSRVGGGANQTLYVKESGVGNTGWIAK